jgi:hypothetical protein
MKRTRTTLALSAIAAALLVPALGAAPSAAAGRPRVPAENCVYSALSEATLARFDALTRQHSSCVVVYANTMKTWAEWERPWFLNRQRDASWAAWATAPGTRRRLVITMSMFPPGLRHTRWRRAGARGRFDGDARTLARNLVAAGLGDSVIRLGAEMNGDWNPDNVGHSRADFHRWVRFWRHEVLAMRSVPGAAFKFDWNVNAAVRPIPLEAIYPGDDVVDIVGVDAYDQGVAPGPHRWARLYGRHLGIRDVLRFARRHGKPLSIPEWGLAPTNVGLGGGDDPSYIRGIARIVQRDRVAYQAYFYKGQFAAQLDRSPASMNAYRRDFGSLR